MLIKPVAAVRLVHRFPDRNYLVVFVTRWRETIAWAERPPEGVRGAQLDCAVCGEPVGFRFYSEAAARSRRTKQLYGALATCLGFFAVFRLLAAVAVAVSVPWLYFAAKENGVVADPDRKNGPHKFTPPDALNAMFAPERRDAPAEGAVVFDDEFS
ncbi:hypothetical protein [Amycolatopsis sp. CA-230715]|uniref:hypothetical protein n=1 Tax=Amycolatopsis sp. CA-230715 TaxID=2745196 RepID=UPI001C032E67|nr:hypothetical protein [Amycolatopsis sp. CA-230715]QWF80947.1 hypothetical protein HUW46_04372 [Amycolatopsis sp. CA-230715]